jgi:hypothetical protein
MAVHMGKKKMVHGGKVKKMAKGGMMKEEKMMKREGRGMAKADMQKKMAKGGMAKKGYHKMPDGKMMKDSAHKGMKKMAYGGKVKKMQEGGMASGNTQAEIEKLNQRIEMLQRQAAQQARGLSQRSTGLGGVPGDMRALAPQGGASLGGMKKGGKVNMSDEKLIKKVARAVNKATGRQDMLAKDKTGPQQEIGMDQRKAKGKFSKYHDKGKEEVALLESAKFAEQELENERKAEDKSKAPKFKKGGSVKAKRDGCAVRGKTRGRMV